MMSSPQDQRVLNINVLPTKPLGNNKKAGDYTEADKPTINPRTSCVKQTLTYGFNRTAKTNPTIDSSPTDTQTPIKELHNQDQDEDWIHTNKQLNEITITDPDTSEKCIPIFSAINLKKKEDVFRPDGLQQFISRCTRRLGITRQLPTRK